MGKEMQVIAKVDEIRDDSMREIEVGDVKLLLVNHDGCIHILGAACTHQGCGLSSGVLTGGRIICPCHQSHFDVQTGRAAEPPALEPLQVYEVHVEAGEVLLAMEHGRPVPVPRAGDRVSLPRAGAHEGPRGGRTCVIIGTGAAGIAAAQAFRALNKGDRLLLVGQESDMPYDRTPLTKEFLQGEKEEPLLKLKADEYYRDASIERMQGVAVSTVDVAKKAIVFENGRSLSWDKLLLATGGVPRPLEVPGAGLAGVHLLRSLQDCRDLLDGAMEAGKAVVYGGSFIAMEAAASLRQRGLDVTVAYRGEKPMAKVFGPEVADMLLALHRENGVRFELGATLEGIEGHGRVSGVRLADGRTVEAGLVLAALGIAPATGMIRGLKLNEDGSIDVDAGMKTSVDNLYAAGDIARFPDPAGSGRVRIEHWRLAQQLGAVAGANMAGGEETYGGVPFFWTGQFGVFVLFCGHAPAWDELIVKGDIGGRDFLGFYVRGGKVAAACSCGMAGETQLAAVSELMRLGAMPGPDEIRAGEVDFMRLLEEFRKEIGMF